jgi:hypothetical protein
MVSKQKYLEAQQAIFRKKWELYLDLQQEIYRRQIGHSSHLMKKNKKLKSCLVCFRWKIWHFSQSQEQLGEQIETSFRDLGIEIDWRIKEIKLQLEGKSLRDENHEKRLEKLYELKERSQSKIDMTS